MGVGSLSEAAPGMSRIPSVPESEFAGRSVVRKSNVHPAKRLWWDDQDRVWRRNGWEAKLEVTKVRKGRARGSKRAKFAKPMSVPGGCDSEQSAVLGDKVFWRGEGRMRRPNDERTAWLGASGQENARWFKRQLVEEELARIESRVGLDDARRVELHILEQFERGREPRPGQVAAALVREDALAGLYERGSAEQKSARYSYRVIASLKLGVKVR
jgi:hypothetical protein